MVDTVVFQITEFALIVGSNPTILTPASNLFKRKIAYKIGRVNDYSNTSLFITNLITYVLIISQPESNYLWIKHISL